MKSSKLFGCSWISVRNAGTETPAEGFLALAIRLNHGTFEVSAIAQIHKRPRLYLRENEPAEMHRHHFTIDLPPFHPGTGFAH